MSHHRLPYLEFLNKSVDGLPVGRHYWPRWVRVRILHRDRYTCKTCGKRLPASKLVVHHLKYTDKVVSENLVTLCNSCHGKSHSKKEEV